MGGFLLVLALLAGWVAWSASWSGRAGKPPAPVTLAPGETGPAGLTVSDLDSVEQLQTRFNADKDTPRLVLALAPT